LIILADEAKEMCSKHKELEQKLMADRIAQAAQIEGNVSVVRNEKKHDGADLDGTLWPELEEQLKAITVEKDTQIRDLEAQLALARCQHGESDVRLDGDPFYERVREVGETLLKMSLTRNIPCEPAQSHVADLEAKLASASKEKAEHIDLYNGAQTRIRELEELLAATTVHNHSEDLSNEVEATQPERASAEKVQGRDDAQHGLL